ncbi:hypothetical protein DCAR_0102329 [Daucus carota subsp. sativus]|uniref:Uncharacterized protein n=1 Tax=Daucus carota subsp. sativus TaxID=79200 RepID=A0A162B3Q0_DAUCS|nr:hypothetical protein DCAR_0102329 [Daucus carota subsp. sativus]
MVFQNKTLSISLIWLIVAASFMMCAYASAETSARPQNADPRFPSLAGCRCCNFILVKNFIQCGTVCCKDGCCGRK